MNTQRPDPTALSDPHAELEREFIAQYLRSHCPGKEGLRGLPEATVRQLRIAASRYASGKLAEVEMRARLVDEVHGTLKPGQLA